MNPSEIKQILARIGGGANKRLGQHFLVDKTTLETIVEAAELEEGDQVLEIGPGLGVLTRELIDRGADVKVIERDRRFISYLSETYPKHLTIVEGDAIRVDWDMTGPWKFISNLPYSITSFVLREALWRKNPPTKIVVLVQREVAERAIAKEGKQSLLSLMVALKSNSARIVRRVAAGAFFPPPKVESAVLEVVPMMSAEVKKRWGIDPELVMQVAKRGFAHPRKLLSSNLGLKDLSILTGGGIAEKARAENLSVEQWVALAEQIN